MSAHSQMLTKTNRATKVHELPPSCRFPLLREGNRAWVRFPLLAGGTLRLRGVGFLRACLFAALPSSASLPPCERDARVPSTRDAGNAGVPPAMPPAREKTYPFEEPQGGGHQLLFFVNSGSAIGITEVSTTLFDRR